MREPWNKVIGWQIVLFIALQDPRGDKQGMDPCCLLSGAMMGRQARKIERKFGWYARLADTTRARRHSAMQPPWWTRTFYCGNHKIARLPPGFCSASRWTGISSQLLDGARHDTYPFPVVLHGYPVGYRKNGLPNHSQHTESFGAGTSSCPHDPIKFTTGWFTLDLLFFTCQALPARFISGGNCKLGAKSV